MAQPVWILSVDLQTKTATFQTGLADAAKAARGSFSDIKGGANEMGGRVGYSMGEARHSVMLLGEEFGVHLPRALTSFIAGLGPIGAALEAAFPFLAIAVGATLLIQHLEKMREAGEKLTDDQMKFGAAVNSAWNTLDQKLIQAQIKSDELRKDHIGALRHELDLIDHQSMEELVHAFETVAKAADVVMKDLEGHWYTWGKGSEGAQHALNEFQTQYNNLLASGKQADADKASGLLHGTAEEAQKVLGLLQQLQTAGRSNSLGAFADPAKWHAANDALNAMHIAHGEEVSKEIEAQQNLVGALNAQIGSEERIAAIKKLEKSNAGQAAANANDKDTGAAARKAMEEQSKLQREFDQNYRESWDYQINTTEAGTADRLAIIRKALEDARAVYGDDAAITKRYATEEYKTWVESGNQTFAAIAKQWDEEDKLNAEAAKEQANNDERMGLLMLAAKKQQIALEDSLRHVAIQQRVDEDTKFANDEFNLKMGVLAKEIAGLNKYGKDYQNTLKQLQDREKQSIQEHENQIAAIKDKAEQERNTRILSAESQQMNALASGLTQSIMGHQTWSRMILSFGNQAVEGMIKNSLLIMMQQDKERLGDAKKAATSAYATGEKIGGPAGIILGPVFAAAAFAGVMAFAGGTDKVPGVGHGDTVPAMLTPGEGVVPGGVMDGLRNMARDGGFSQRPSMTVHVRPTYHVQTIDGDGMQAALNKHSDQLQRHFENTLRKMNY